MLNPSAVGDSGKVSVRRSVFSQTCALLGQFVKEKRAFGDLRDMSGGSNKALLRTTMNLFPVNNETEEVPISKNGEPMSLFPQQASSTALMPNSSEIKSAPMTIFYAGQVIVFNDFPADKAKEIIKLASLEIPQNPNTTTPVVALDDNNNGSNSDHLITESVLDSSTLIPPRLNVHPTSLCNDHQAQNPAQNLIPTIFKDLPQVRKASLQRFLVKRKDRIAARAPYNRIKREDVRAKSNSSESNSWLGFAAAAGAGAGLP